MKISFLAAKAALTGCSSVWLERALREREAFGSSPNTPTFRPLQQTIYGWLKELLFVNDAEWVQVPQNFQRSSLIL